MSILGSTVPLTITKGDSTTWSNLKVNTGAATAVQFTGAGPTYNTRLDNVSIEGWTSCGIDFGTGAAPSRTFITGEIESFITGEIESGSGSGNQFCHKSNSTGVAYFTQPITTTYTYPTLQTGTIAGVGSPSFALGLSTVVGSGASIGCTTGTVCDSISGSVTFSTGSGVSTTGTAFTITFPFNRVSKPNCVWKSVNGSGGAELPLFINALSTANILTITSSSALPSGIPGNAFYYSCGGE
jgi:hypothetical protein